jgi:prepilin-type processing-associated H-X9-DG protein
VTAAIFRLIVTEGITPEVFICPSVEAAATQPIEGPDRLSMDNFEKPNQLCYSYCNPYPSEAAVDAGYKLDVTQVSAEFAVFADLNPGVDELLTVTTASDEEHMRKVNSTNHDGDGQNVLYGDGHVEFQNNPFVGIQRDNIYTYGKSGETSGGDGIIGSPTTKDDSILLPTAKQGAATTQPAGK